MRVEDRMAGLALRLGAIQRDVGVAQQVLGLASGPAERDADRRGHEHSRPRPPSGRPAPPGRARRPPWPPALGDVLEEDGELVAAHAGDRVARAQGARRAARDRCSSWSPTWWPSESLTALKPSRSRKSTAAPPPVRAAPRPAQRPVEPVDEERAVGQPGQRVVQGVVLQTLYRAPVRDRVEQGALQRLGVEVRGRAGGRRRRAPRAASTATSPLRSPSSITATRGSSSRSAARSPAAITARAAPRRGAPPPGRRAPR